MLPGHAAARRGSSNASTAMTSIKNRLLGDHSNCDDKKSSYDTCCFGLNVAAESK